MNNVKGLSEEQLVTQLHNAIGHGTFSEIEGALEAGANPNMLGRHNGLTALQLCAKHGASHFVPLLVKYGAFLDAITVVNRDYGIPLCSSPLYIAILNEKRTMCYKLIECGARYHNLPKPPPIWIHRFLEFRASICTGCVALISTRVPYVDKNVMRLIAKHLYSFRLQTLLNNKLHKIQKL